MKRDPRTYFFKEHSPLYLPDFDLFKKSAIINGKIPQEKHNLLEEEIQNIIQTFTQLYYEVIKTPKEFLEYHSASQQQKYLNLSDDEFSPKTEQFSFQKRYQQAIKTITEVKKNFENQGRFFSSTLKLISVTALSQIIKIAEKKSKSKNLKVSWKQELVQEHYFNSFEDSGILKLNHIYYDESDQEQQLNNQQKYYEPELNKRKRNFNL